MLGSEPSLYMTCVAHSPALRCFKLHSIIELECECIYWLALECECVYWFVPQCPVNFVVLLVIVMYEASSKHHWNP
eukprot:4318165-Amphidinium_carterae.1